MLCKGDIMAPNFEMSLKWDCDCLHLDLLGNFDETSACNLIDALQNNCQGAVVVFIHAKGLTRIHPSGRAAFQENLHALRDFCYRLVFADTNAAEIAPQWVDYF